MDNDYNNVHNNGQQPTPPQEPQPGQSLATGSLVCGIISLVAGIFFGWTAFLALVGIVIGIVGIVLAINAKKQGNTDGTATAGLVLSIIGACISGVMFVACIACICISGAIVNNMDGSSFDFSSFDFNSFDFDSFLDSITS